VEYLTVSTATNRNRRTLKKRTYLVCQLEGTLLMAVKRSCSRRLPQFWNSECILQRSDKCCILLTFSLLFWGHSGQRGTSSCLGSFYEAVYFYLPVPICPSFVRPYI